MDRHFRNRKMIDTVAVPASSGPPQLHLDKEINPARFPNFAYVVATDERGEKIVVRIECERTTVQ
jgi:hypothetical protein